MLAFLHRFWTASIGRQLMLGIALVHAVLMTIFVFDLVTRQRDFLVKESREQAISLAETLAVNGTSWVLARDYVGIEEVIHSQFGYPGLRYALFTDLQGHVLGYSDHSQVGKYVNDPISLRLLQSPPGHQVQIDNNLLVDVAHPIMVNQHHIGWTRVGISREDISTNLKVVTYEGLLYTLIAISVGVLFAWLMSHGLTRDIRRLAGFATGIESGKRDDHCHLDRPDELGQLARDMNRMLDTLVAREHEVDSMNDRMRANEERLRHALEGSTDGLWDWNLTTNEAYYSPRCKEMLGYQDHEIANDNASWQTRVHPDDLPGVQASTKRHLEDPENTPYEILHRLRHKDGGWRWILARGRAHRDADGRLARMVGTHVDVTEQKRLETTLYEERERALVTLRSIGDGVITTDANGRITFLNPIAEALTGWRSEEAGGCTLEEIFPIFEEITRAPVDNLVERCIRERRVICLDNHTLLINREGREIAISNSAAPILSESSHINGVVLVFHDVSSARQMQRKIEYQASHDDLTGLWSRTAFDHRLEEQIEQALRGVGEHVLIYIDLDQFKVVNDTVGHVAGDELLKQVASLLLQHSRESDILARLGGDEFGLLLIGCNLEHGKRVAEQLRLQLADFPFAWEDHHFQIGASFGIVQIDENLPDPNALSLADLACYSAKDQGRNRVHVYQTDDQLMVERRSEMKWVVRVKQALKEDRLVLYSQRIQALSRDPATQDFREVLVRMTNDEGLVMPGQFIPAAERYDIMHLVDEWVIHRACNWLLDPAHAKIHFFINLSGGSLANPHILELIEDRLRQHPELGKQICLEITETAAIGNLQQALKYMQRLKSRKVRFALDDFGSGLSSLNYLKNLPVDYVKIDGCFIRDLLSNPVDAAMVESICHISTQMGIETIAEFVEDRKLIDWLTVVGVDYAQGFGIEKPQPI